MVTVSVIMTSYNHESYISEAIESVLNQTYKDLELIIVDDFSIDKSKEVIEKYVEIDSRIHAMYNEKNEGIANTLNKAIRNSKGKYLSFIASDDLWFKNKIEKQLNILEKDENLILWSEGEIIDSLSRLTGEKVVIKHGGQYKQKSGNIFSELLKGNYIFATSLMFKKENASNIEFDNQLKYLNDYKYVLDLASKYNYYYIEEPLAYYRIHEKNTVSKDRSEWNKDFAKLTKYLIETYGNKVSIVLLSANFLPLIIPFDEVRSLLFGSVVNYIKGIKTFSTDFKAIEKQALTEPYQKKLAALEELADTEREKVFQELLELNKQIPNNPEILNNLGVISFYSGDLVNALEYLSDAVCLDYSNKDYLDNYSLVLNENLKNVS